MGKLDRGCKPGKVEVDGWEGPTIITLIQAQICWCSSSNIFFRTAKGQAVVYPVLVDGSPERSSLSVLNTMENSTDRPTASYDVLICTMYSHEAHGSTT